MPKRIDRLFIPAFDSRDFAFLRKENQPGGENTFLSPPGPGRKIMKGSITSRGENTWLIRYYLPGSKKQKSVTFKGSYEDAEFKLADLQREAKTGFATEPEKITVAECHVPASPENSPEGFK
ncbi:hypothetical protein [Desulfotomaculum copahuensis]|uniref:Uncharacterized protein n=1 Tax=Desulfotomaculum copahuensis TaxID=1838280 RepID=A0A1B7LGG9_9FIRM|nr:hypothetical protein [Desulfotomaculum copahuensis]OAT85184.1 hypothetical protein A6M21_06450 [Desulfotomaculum copahuensis]